MMAAIEPDSSIDGTRRHADVDLGRNFVSLVIDGVSWSVTYSFVGLDSVMPLLISQLTDSALVIGLTGTVYTAGWLLPQLAMARLINEKQRKKPYMLAGLSGRIMFWGTALGLWTGLARNPVTMVTVLLVLLGFLAVTDSLTTVALFDITSRVLPTGRRGRMFGLAQVIGGTLGIGAGVIVAHVLASPSLPFPSNFAVLFTLAGVTIIPSTVALALVREPPPVETRQHHDAHTRTRWLTLIASDLRFRRLMSCQVLVMMIQLSSPFFVVHASEGLHLPQRIAGSFVSALAITGVIASAILGLVSERWGSHYVIRIGSGIAVMGPLLALAAHFYRGLTPAYALVFVALGVANSVRLLGFRTYLMDIAREGMRPAYIGVANTILGTLTLAPMMGGWLLETTSYVVLFSVTAIVMGLGFVLSVTLDPA